jgi:hypothetical protein
VLWSGTDGRVSWRFFVPQVCACCSWDRWSSKGQNLQIKMATTQYCIAQPYMHVCISEVQACKKWLSLDWRITNGCGSSQPKIGYTFWGCFLQTTQNTKHSKLLLPLCRITTKKQKIPSKKHCQRKPSFILAYLGMILITWSLLFFILGNCKKCRLLGQLRH